MTTLTIDTFLFNHWPCLRFCAWSRVSKITDGKESKQSLRNPTELLSDSPIRCCPILRFAVLRFAWNLKTIGWMFVESLWNYIITRRFDFGFGPNMVRVTKVKQSFSFVSRSLEDQTCGRGLPADAVGIKFYLFFQNYFGTFLNDFPVTWGGKKRYKSWEHL